MAQRLGFPAGIGWAEGRVMAAPMIWLLAVTLALVPARFPGASTQPAITLSVTSGSVGTPVTITGSGFPPGEIVALYIDSPGPYLGFPGPRADAQGAFHTDIKFPGKGYDSSGRVDPARPGPHNICGDTAAGSGNPQPVAAKACVQFLVQAPSAPAKSVNQPGASFPSALIAIAILVLTAAGAVIWLRRRM